MQFRINRFPVRLERGAILAASLLVPALLAAALLSEAASRRPVTVLDYLKSISGRQIVSGIHNREPNSQPARQTDRIVE